ncbi:MAG: 16S rRNA (adenine(1518)-N(6)/adenine(1519)-N(6))-dimethyltransferase RsmA [Chloroflexia bacterium]
MVYPIPLSSETLQLASRRGVRAALSALGVRSSRRLGQHFLVEPAALVRILEAADLKPGDAVLEVGPGLGVLTGELLRRAGRVVAVEIDRRLCAWLRERFGHLPHFTLVEDDILKVAPGLLMGPSPYLVVANLPYAITSAALRHLLEAEPRPRRLVVMVQWEVARRIAAAPPEMSLLALAVQYYARPEVVARVPAGAFFPVPQVDSAVVHLEVFPQPRLPLLPEVFFRLAHAAFAHPRQQIGKTLAAGLGRPREEVVAALEAAGVDPRRRPETLALEEWAAIGTAWTGISRDSQERAGR